MNEYAGRQKNDADVGRFGVFDSHRCHRNIKKEKVCSDERV